MGCTNIQSDNEYDDGINRARANSQEDDDDEDDEKFKDFEEIGSNLKN
jgi:hypothetical protein